MSHLRIRKFAKNSIPYRGVATGVDIGVYTPPPQKKSAQINFLWGKMTLERLFYSFIHPQKFLYPPKTNFWLRPCYHRQLSSRRDQHVVQSSQKCYIPVLSACAVRLFSCADCVYGVLGIIFWFGHLSIILINYSWHCTLHHLWTRLQGGPKKWTPNALHITLSNIGRF